MRQMRHRHCLRLLLWQMREGNSTRILIDEITSHWLDEQYSRRPVRGLVDCDHRGCSHIVRSEVVASGRTLLGEEFVCIKS